MLNKQIIIYLCSYLERNDIDLYRQCNNYLSILLGPIYFKDIKMKVQNRNVYQGPSRVYTGRPTGNFILMRSTCSSQKK